MDSLALFGELNHHVRDFNILFGLVLGGHLENDVLLVRGNGLLADVLHKLAHAIISVSARIWQWGTRNTYERGRRSLTLDGG